MKELNINGKIFAKYEMEGDMIFIKVLVWILPDNESISEDLLIKIIQNVENRTFTKAAYLNV